MPFEFHPEATRNFNAKGAELSTRAVSGPLADNRTSGFRPNRYIMGSIGDSDLAPDSFAWTELRTPLGEPHGVTVFRNGQAVSLPADGHAALDQLADGLSRTKTLRDLIGPKEIAKIVLEWVWHSRCQSEVPTMAEYVLREVAAHVREMTIWLPIHGLAIERDFSLAGVTLRTIRQEILDAYCQRLIESAPPDQAEAARMRAQTVRKRLQGITAAVVTIRAEPNRAASLAAARSTGALTILRFWSPPALVPQARSYLTLMGGEHIEQRTYFTTSDDRIVTFSEKLMDENTQFGHALGESQIAELLNGFSYFDRLFSLDDPNDFQEDVRSALDIFGRATLYPTVSEKLIHILITLESLLLRNESEPIQDNLGWRIAYAHNSSAEDRLEKLSTIRATYKLRSKFLHHGVTIRPELADMELLGRFMKIAWVFLYELPRFAFNFDSKTSFLDMLDKRRAGG